MNIENKIGKATWFDLPVTDIVNGRSFYEGLFKWQFLLMNDSAVPNYWVIQAGDELIGGIRKIDREGGNDGGPILYFTVDNLDNYARRVKELGGQLVGDKVDLGNGRGLYQWFRDREDNLLALWSPENNSNKEKA